MRQRLTIWFYRLLLLGAMVGVWQAGVDRDLISHFFFGSPEVIAARLYDWFATGVIFKHLWITLVETLLAFAIGTGLGLGIGLALALNATMSAVLDPFIKGANSMPRLILAPIFAVWFGLGIWSKVALGVTIVFFIVFFNVYQGVKEVSPVVLANARMLGANRGQLIKRVYVPSAMSWVFSSLHVSIGMAFVGAVIGEYLGSSAGVGYLILQAEGTFDIDTVLAGIFLLTLFALLLDGLITLAEKHLLRWRPKAE